MSKYFISTYSFSNKRKGGLGFYALILLVLGLGFAVFVFLPDYREIQDGIYKASCNDITTKINSAIEDYNTSSSKVYAKPGSIIDLDTLKEKGYLDEIKYCPQKGTFMYDEKGKVICTIHSRKEVKK